MASFRLPNQTNRLALIMDPLTDQVPFTFGIEIFEKGHKTTPHTHPSSQELFFILAGQALRLHLFDIARRVVSSGAAQAVLPAPSGRLLIECRNSWGELHEQGEAGRLPNMWRCLSCRAGRGLL